MSGGVGVNSQLEEHFRNIWEKIRYIPIDKHDWRRDYDHVLEFVRGQKVYRTKLRFSKRSNRYDGCYVYAYIDADTWVDYITEDIDMENTTMNHASDALALVGGRGEISSMWEVNREFGYCSYFANQKDDCSMYTARLELTFWYTPNPDDVTEDLWQSG